MSRALTWLFASILIASSAVAQKGEEPASAYRIEALTTRYRFEPDGSGERIESLRVHLLTSAAFETFGQLVFPFEGETQRVTVEQMDVSAAGVRKASVADAEILEVASPVVAELATYSDQREAHVVVPRLAAGDLLEYRVRTTISRSLAPGDFWLEHRWRDDDVVQELLEVDVPASVAIVLEDRTGVEREDVVENDRRLLSWRHTPSPAAPSDSDAADAPLNFFDFLDGEEWTEPDVELSSFETWDAMASWFSRLQYPQQVGVGSDRLRQVVTTQVGGRDPIEELFHFVRREIRYVSLSFGIGRYQPHRAVDVLDHAHGDCKDKHTLLAALLSEAGVTAYPALVSTFREPDLDVPSPAQFDHVVTAIVEGTGYRFVDATGPGMPFGLLAPEIRGKNALVVTPEGGARWVRLAEAAPFETWSRISIDASLEANGTIKGRGVASMRGDLEVAMRELLAGTPNSVGVAGMLLAFGFGGKATAISSGDPMDTREPLIVRFDYERRGSPPRAGGGIQLPSPTGGFLLASVTGDEVDRVEGMLDRYEVELALALPDGVELDLPVSMRLDHPFGAYSATYELEDRTFRVRRDLLWKRGELATADDDTRKAFVQSVIRDGSQGPRVRVAPTAPTGASSDAEKLERSAVMHLERKEGAEALRDLERLTAVQPGHPRAWAYTSAAHLLMNDAEAALAAAQRQLEVNPESPDAYRQIGRAHMVAGRLDEAIAAFQQQVARVPLDGKTYLALGTALLRTDRITESVAAMTKAASILPESAEVNGALAFALFRAGRREEAVAKARDLESIDDIGVLVGLGNEAARVGEIDLGRRLLLRAVDRQPEHPTAWLALGGISLAQGDTETAMRYLNRHLDLYPGDSRATVMIQMARGELGGDLRSSLQIDALVDNDERRAETYVRNAALHLQARRKTEALASLEQALATSDAAPVRARVAYYLAQHRLDEMRAASLADAALSQLVLECETLDAARDPAEVDRALRDLAMTWWTMGIVAFMNLDLAAAKPYLTAAVLWLPRAESAELLASIHEYEKNPRDATRYYAIALAAEGVPTTAKANLERVLSSGESADERVRLEWGAHRARLELRPTRPAIAQGMSQALIRLDRGGTIEEVRLLAPAPALQALVDQLPGSRFGVEFPERSPARLVARAEIECAGDTDFCLVRLLTPAFRM